MRVLIVGNGASGRSVCTMLEKLGYEAEFAKTTDINTYENLSDENYKGRLFSGLSFIVTSPGVSFDAPILKEARKAKIKIIGEFEFACEFLKGDKITVTGTNGKTTTVSIINFLLRNSERQVHLGGNIGIPVSNFALSSKNNDISVLEASSFQLEKICHFHTHIGAILNISPDHLNRHKTMRAYIRAKQNISKNQTKNDYLLINADDNLLMENIPKTRAKILFFSTKRKVVGCYVKRGCIYFNDNQHEEKLVSLKNIKLVGSHNVSNILCAVLAVYLETNNKSLLQDIDNFQGVEHRIEYVKMVEGISFFNDSKATNISSTIVALQSFKSGINLILGGSDKGYDFDELFAKIPKNVKNIAVFGQTKQKIANSAKKFNFKNIFICDTLKSATNLCFKLSKKGEVVLLSPACASFDQFKNFEERGAVFKKIVEEIGLNENALGVIKTN